ncbi:GNAT family N-acetyltransferase [uncultured Selenomonas sp.]|uniref:GNAT family N-acetyltransferase n=1 Tax=uncultured Selenomonas sp. TaxID=159275 RepID=UPI0026759F65|nr:GNAT family N-acetyltransferase [uncultured Selenomonas sp.]
MNIVFEKERSRSAAYDGASCIGYAVIEESGGRWVIPHTEVDPTYGGQGIARRLIEEIIAAARREGRKIVPVCSYAAKMMLQRKDAYRDVLEKH